MKRKKKNGWKKYWTQKEENVKDEKKKRITFYKDCNIHNNPQIDVQSLRKVIKHFGVSTKKLPFFEPKKAPESQDINFSQRFEFWSFPFKILVHWQLRWESKHFVDNSIFSRWFPMAQKTTHLIFMKFWKNVANKDVLLFKKNVEYPSTVLSSTRFETVGNSFSENPRKLLTTFRNSEKYSKRMQNDDSFSFKDVLNFWWHILKCWVIHQYASKMLKTVRKIIRLFHLLRIKEINSENDLSSNIPIVSQFSLEGIKHKRSNILAISKALTREFNRR